jgi:hypothetical protein
MTRKNYHFVEVLGIFLNIIKKGEIDDEYRNYQA